MHARVLLAFCARLLHCACATRPLNGHKKCARHLLRPSWSTARRTARKSQANECSVCLSLYICIYPYISLCIVWRFCMRCSHHSEGYMAARGAKGGWIGDEGSLYQRNLRKVNEVACKRGEGAGREGFGYENCNWHLTGPPQSGVGSTFPRAN